MTSLSLGDPETYQDPDRFRANTQRKPSVEINAALGVSAFVLAATVGGFRMGLLVMIAINGSRGRTLRREVVNHR